MAFKLYTVDELETKEKRMTNDVSSTNLREPDKMDWDNYNPGSKYTPPPQPKGPDGKYVTFFGQLPQAVPGATDEGLREYLFDPITIVKSGQADGYQLRFTRVNVKKFTNKKTGLPMDASKAGNLLKAAAIQAKPQTNREYDAAMGLTKGRVVPLTIEWWGKNKDTQEVVSGYDSFPLDPERPGQRKTILKQGDTYLDRDGFPQVLKGEVLFANAQVRYFIDPARK